MRLPLAALAVALVAAVVHAGSTSAATPRTLHVGSTGQQVKNLQWLLTGNRPSVYRIRAWRGPIDGHFTAQVDRSVRNMKWRLGYPRARVNGTAGRLLFDLLEGKRPRPRLWIGLASRRVHTQHDTPTPCSQRLIRTARDELGVHEIPDGSNDSPRIRAYQAVTGAFRQPWCASFAQWALTTIQVGPIADRSASVFHIVEWARAHGYLTAQPQAGALVTFLRALGHMGIVETVTPHGFYSIEGNHSNRVARVWHPTGDQLTVFVHLPNCT